METAELSVDVRPRVGKQQSAKTRREGGIPAVLYGPGGPPQAIAVNEAALNKLLRASGNRISFINLRVKDGSSENLSPAIIKAIQRHPVNESIVHIDFQRVSVSEKMTVEIPIKVEGTPAGATFGGIIQQPVRTVRVRCLPTNIPDAAVAEVSAMNIGDVFSARDLRIPSDAELQTDPDLTILSIVVTHYQEEETAQPEAAAAAEVPAQPEVIGEKEREERRLKKDDEKDKRAAEKAEIKEAKKEEQ